MGELVSAAICLECGTLLLSYHVHHYTTCDCPNSAMLDGGSQYCRVGALDLTKIDTTCYNINTGYLENGVPNYASTYKAQWPY